MGATQRALIVFLLVATLPPVAQAASPPECLAYAFTEAEDHHFLIQNDSIAYGSNLTVIHNCPGRVELWSEEIFIAEGESGFTVPIGSGNFTSIQLRSINQSWTFENVEIRPDRLSWEIDWTGYMEYLNPSMVPESEAIQMQNWAAGATGLIIWVLCTYVFWNLVNSYIQRNFVEEVMG